MSMTLEEAFSILQEKYDYCKSFYDLAANPEKDYKEMAKYLQALQAVLVALRRERVEKVWKGEWKYPTCEWNLPKCSNCGCNSKDATYGHKSNFCPRCGAPMTDEAVEMVMERLEALHNA